MATTCTSAARTSLLLAFLFSTECVLLTANLSAQSSDQLSVRAGYFATPIQLPGDTEKRQISAIEINCESMNEEETAGTVRIIEGEVQFNEFGDASMEQTGQTEYSVRLEPIAIKSRLPHRFGRRGKGRLYRVVFENPFCDSYFQFNYSMDGIRAHQLIQHDPAKNDFEPSQEQVYVLEDLVNKRKAPFGDEPTGEYLDLHAPLIRRQHLGSRGSVSISGQTGGEGIFNLGLSSFASFPGFASCDVQFVAQDIVDPLDLQRKVFAIEGDIRWIYEPGPLDPEVTVTIVVSPNTASEHRLIIWSDDKITDVIRTTHPSWEDYALFLDSLKSEIEIATVLTLREKYNRSIYFSGNDGEVNFVRLHLDADDALLSELIKFHNLKSVRITYCDNVTQSGIEALSSLRSLESLYYSTLRMDPGVLSSIAELSTIKELQLSQGRRSRVIDPQEFRQLINLSQLEKLELTNMISSDEALAVISGFSKLESLALRGNEESLSAILKLREDLPTCNLFSSNSGGQPSQIRISADGKLVVIEGKFTEAEFSGIEKLTDMQSLSISQSATDEVLNLVSKHCAPSSVTLNRCREVSDAGIRSLESITSLKSLRLEDCSRLTDGCADSLAKMSNLNSLLISRSGISEAAILKIKHALPDCEIVHYPDRK